MQQVRVIPSYTPGLELGLSLLLDSNQLEKLLPQKQSLQAALSLLQHPPVGYKQAAAPQVKLHSVSSGLWQVTPLPYLRETEAQPPDSICHSFRAVLGSGCLHCL